MKKDMLEQQGDIKYDVPWTTLGEYSKHLEKRGVVANVASFVGATTVRIHVLGLRRPAAHARGAGRRCAPWCRQAMEEGALGVGSSLIYAPAFYADTDELIELCKVAGRVPGHVHLAHAQRRQPAPRSGRRADRHRPRGQGAGRDLSPQGGRPGELAQARRGHRKRSKPPAPQGCASPPTCTPTPPARPGSTPPCRPGCRKGASTSGSTACKTRPSATGVREMRTPTDEWENLLLAAGSPDNVLLVGFKNDALKPLTGKTLAEVARQRGKTPEETAMDLVIEDDSRVDTVYFLMAEDNVERKKIALPWVSFGSDAGSRRAGRGVPEIATRTPAPTATSPACSASTSATRRSSRSKKPIRKLTSLPADEPGHPRPRAASSPATSPTSSVFDPATIQDHATYEKPHQYATGMRHVLVNGMQVLKDGEHTGGEAGRAVWGPGKKG